MADLTATTLTLGQLADQAGLRVPTVVIGGGPAVVLSRTDDNQVEVYQAGNVASYPAASPVLELLTPAVRQTVLAQAARHLHQLATETAETRQDEGLDHVERLDQIRAYAIDRHRDGLVCLPGLNDFLYAFGLAGFEPYMKVSYTIRGTFEMDGEYDHHVRRHRPQIRVQLPDCHDVVGETSRYSVEIDTIEYRDRADDDTV